MNSNNIKKENQNTTNEVNVNEVINNVENSSTHTKNNNKNKIFLIIGIVVLVLIILSIISIILLSPTVVIDDDNSLENSEKENVAVENKVIQIYAYEYPKSEYGDGFLSIRDVKTVENDSNEYKEVGTYKCTNSDCMLKHQVSRDYETVIIKDGNYLVYNFKTEEAKKINLEKYQGKINYIDNETDMCSGLGSLCIESKKVGENKYYLISVESEGEGVIAGIIDSNLNPIFLLTDDEYNSDDKWDNLASYLTFLDNGNFIYINGNKFYTYDAKNKKISNSKEYKSVELIDENGYIVVVDNDDYLKVLDFEGKEKAKLVKISNNMSIHNMLSGWYEQDKKEGIYVVVQDSKASYEELSESMKKELNYNGQGMDYGYEYYYIPSTGEIGKIATYIGGYAKPVLYLYPTKNNTKVTVTFEKPNLLTTTYPKYKNKWEVTANKNGDLYDSNNKYYYGLYWEESGTINVDFEEGFYVTKDNAINFLEEKLTTIGLNAKERNEFIMYWLPILEKNDKSLVYFELTDSRENYNKLIINPKPDSLLRVAIHVKKVNEKTNIKRQELKKFERKGFTAVEWGGVIH